MTREQQWIVLFLSLSLALFFFLTNPRRVMNSAVKLPAQNASTQESQEILVEVDGSIEHRGIYRARAGMTVEEILQKAGGTRPTLEMDADELLRELEQSCRLNILATGGGKGKVLTEPMAAEKKKVLSIPININSATLGDLDTLPGIGPKTAQSIITYREKNGSFKSEQELLNVPGIGRKKLAVLLPHITTKTGERSEGKGER